MIGEALDTDEGGDGKDRREDDDDRREDTEKFHERGCEDAARHGLEHKLDSLNSLKHERKGG